MNRRQFVAAVAATLATPALARAATPVWTYRGTSGRLLAGILSTTDPTRHVRAIAALRRQTGYARPLLYASTDKLKLPFALGVIDHLAASDDIWFAVDRGAEPGTTGGEPELAQLAAFLTGCAYGDLAGTRHPLKRILIDALHERTSLTG
ncbi:MAG: hypothetical protein WDM94_10405 [Bauldia sp.]